MHYRYNHYLCCYAVALFTHSILRIVESKRWRLSVYAWKRWVKICITCLAGAIQLCTGLCKADLFPCARHVTFTFGSIVARHQRRQTYLPGSLHQPVCEVEYLFCVISGTQFGTTALKGGKCRITRSHNNFVP